LWFLLKIKLYEPKNNNEPFVNPLSGCHNLVLTPHIGGSTEESQVALAAEVSSKLVRYAQTGDSSSALNMPQISLVPPADNCQRLIVIHLNKPGSLAAINDLITASGVNIVAEQLRTKGSIGTAVLDIEGDLQKSIVAELEAQDIVIKLIFLTK